MVKMSESTLHNLFDKLAGFDRDKIIKEVMKANALSRETATNYYYQWKRIFINSNDCIPKEIKKELAEQETEEPPKDEAANDPDAIIKAAKELHKTSTEPIREFTEEEKEEVKALESSKVEELESDELSMILKCNIFTYKIDKNGIEVIDGATDKVTQESVFEQQRALNLADMFNKYFLKGVMTYQ